MNVEFIYPEFEVIRNADRCIACRICERQCANDVHHFDEEHRLMTALCRPMSDQSAENRQKRLYVPGEFQLVQRHNQGDL